MKPSIPKGTRDFSPLEVKKRNYIFETIKDTFIKYGFSPIETPSMERLDTLMGKYGEEGDRLLFKILNNGDFLKKADNEALNSLNSTKLVQSISSRGLRYDLTVPFARYVAMYQNDIEFPFKRYQIQPVWRADRPQKGRFQEFYQCDVDVVGSDSLMYEAELTHLFAEVFKKLKISIKIKINNRKILAGLAEVAGVEDQMMAMTIALDKLDKVGIEGVERELVTKGFSAKKISSIIKLLGNTDLESLTVALQKSEIGKEGIEEIREVERYIQSSGISVPLEYDVTLARGLNYYTGCIFEVIANDVKIGSIGGGGRYDDLTAVFGLKGISGVGISFGAERIYLVMEELGLFPTFHESELQLLILAMNQEAHKIAYRHAFHFRAEGINTEIYPAPVKMKKQMKYANARNVPFVVILGSEEIESEKLMLKDMRTGDQELLSLDAVLQKVRKLNV